MLSLRKFEFGRPIIISVLIITIFLLSSLPIAAGSDYENNESNTRQNTRAEDREFNSGGSVTLTSGDWGNIWVHNGTTLTLENKDITVVDGKIFNVTDSSTLIIKNSELYIESGFFEAICQNVTIENSKIHVTHKNNQFYPDGLSSRFTVDTIDPLTILDSDILSEGDFGDTSGLGGDGEIFLNSDAGVTVRGLGDGIEILTKKYFGVYALGGDGGAQDARSHSRVGRRGGKGIISIEAGGTVNIQDTILVAKGGSGGSPSGQGGDAQIDITATGHAVSIIRSEFGPYGGIDGNNKDDFGGEGTLNSNSNIFTVDEPNYMATKDGALTTLYGLILNIEAPAKCRIYNPEFVSIKPKDNKLHSFDDQTTISLFFWLKVLVKDNSGKIIEDAAVSILDKNDFEIESRKTDSNGYAEFNPIEGRSITKADDSGLNQLKIKANAYGEPGEKAIFLLESKEEEVVINLLTITIVSVNDQLPSEGMQVGCSVVIKGTCLRPSAAGNIDSVAAAVDGIAISPGPVDDSNDNSWVDWSLTWNSEEVTDGLHNITMTVHLGSLTDSDWVTVDVNQKSCNHAPQVTEITTPKDNANLTDTDADPYFTIGGKAFDVDYDSTELGDGDGKAIQKVIIQITDSSGKAVLTQEILGQFMDYETSSGIYSWNFSWKTRETTSDGYFIYPNGKYKITASALDDGAFPSESWGTKNITVNIYHNIVPVSIIHQVDEKVVEDHSMEIGIETDKKKVSVAFNGNQSYDIDGSIEDLEFLWDFDDGTTTDFGKFPKITHEFSVSEKHTTFKVTLTVRDKDQLTSQPTKDSEVTIKIIYTPPPEDPAAPFAEFYSIDMKSQTISTSFIILVILVNVLGALIIVFRFRQVDKTREAQRLMMEKQRKELAEEIAKQRAEGGYGDYTSAYMISPAEAKAQVKPTEEAQAASQPPATPSQTQQQKPSAPPQTQRPPVAPPPQQASQPPATTSQAQQQPPATPQQAQPQQPQQQQQQPQAAPQQTATVQTPGAAQPPQQVQVQQGTPQAPSGVTDPAAQMRSYQVRQCPNCRATVHSGWKECPKCKAKL